MEQPVTSHDPRPPGDPGSSRIKANTPRGKTNIMGKGLKMCGYGQIVPAIHAKTTIQELPSVGKKPKNIRFY